MTPAILVPTDGSSFALRALPFALRLSRWTERRLILVHAAPAPEVEAATADLMDVTHQLGGEGVLVDVFCPVLPSRDRETVAQTILTRACAEDSRLIALSTHGRSGLGRWLYGSVAEQILQRAPMPLLFVTASCDHEWPDSPPLRILVPLDGSDTAEAILQPLRELMSIVPAELCLTRVIATPETDVTLTYPMLGPYMTRDFRHGSAAAQHAFDAAWEYLDDVAATFRSVARDIDVQVRVGHAAPVITRLARERNVHLIAMATHGRTGLARVVLGSTAIGTLHRTDVPLLLIRPGTLRQGGSVEHPAAA